MTNFTPITFAQDKSNSKMVVADRYVPHDIYVLNKDIIEALGGIILKGVGGFKAEFKKIADAKKFVAQAITSISAKEYKANRKTEKPTTTGKGSKKSTRKGKGNVTPSKAVTEVKEVKKPTRKGKGNAELTDAGKKALDRMKASVLNRAASAYSIANGGEATTFSALGKSAKDLSAYIPKAKEALLKSPKWAKASEAHGLTEDMLDC